MNYYSYRKSLNVTTVITCGLLSLFYSANSKAQTLQPGFDAAEYGDLLQLNFVIMGDTVPIATEYAMNKGSYKKLFRSPEVGLYNRCEVYTRNNNTVVISLRGTVGKAESWLENFYFAMVKANGSFQLNDSTNFSYKLAADSQAFVHVGWLLGLASLAPYITQQLEPLLAKGITSVIVMGHSQGGALAFLTTSYLWYKYHDKYPGMQLKTYASAAPKPGNLYYAYDFDYISRNGYGFRIVNSADWVPETPVSIQTINDFNSVNPIIDAKQILKKQKFIARVALTHVYNKLNNSSYRAMKNYRKYMGNTMGKQVNKALPQFQPPAYEYGINYMTAGAPIILVADSVYHAKFPYDGKDKFVHHMLKPYMYLLNQYYPNKH